MAPITIRYLTPKILSAKNPPMIGIPNPIAVKREEVAYAFVSEKPKLEVRNIINSETKP